MARHFIGMAGISGCLPATCAAYETRTQAAESLAAIHERGKGWAARLRRDGIAALRPEDGNDYAEIIACDCDAPEDHNDA